MHFQIDHIVLNVLDMKKMLHFYVDILQLQPERLEAFHDKQVAFPSVRLSAETIIDLFPQDLWEKSCPEVVGRPNLNHFCLVTDHGSWVQLHDRLIEYRIAIDEGPVKRWGAHGSGFSYYFRDPEENVIEIRYYEREEDDQRCVLGS